MKPPVWFWIVAACAMHLTVWTAWFILAARHPVMEVPLRAVPASRAPMAAP